MKYRPGIALEETGGCVGIEIAGRDLDNGVELGSSPTSNK